ncbi:MAG: NAD(P)H-binding protein [Hydrogenophaga sp.]|uniref:NmrA family NAD(P)-binding protein n=1 Tax=Hydrogenophaga sp. TaxID=1904254 RepID=UPI002ABBC464|nr:NAD(P)H-binding protein [Hydrogenophaga sp.]MDZ4187712.1 NAD(P)H-binding protein [Hydrogenophaga sp.]
MTTTLVIGANGQIGSTLATLLASQGHTVRRATSRAASQPDEVTVNLATGEGLAAALTGADQLFLMAPPGYANQQELLIPAIDAARAAGVHKVLLLSAMGANADDNIPLRQAELHLEHSGLAWNVIRPNWFMQNFHTFWLHGIQTQGQIFLPVGDAKGSFIDTRDIAAVAAKLLSGDEFVNAAHDLTGSESLDHTQVAAILSQAAGRTIGYTDIPEEAMRQGLLGAGLPADYTEFLLIILGAFKAGFAAHITNAVQQITGQEPIRLEQYAQDFKSHWA